MSLLAHPVLAELITPARGRAIPSTPRGTALWCSAASILRGFMRL